MTQIYNIITIIISVTIYAMILAKISLNIIEYLNIGKYVIHLFVLYMLYVMYTLCTYYRPARAIN